MKRIAIILAAALAVLSCSKKWNDLVHEEVPAEVTAFEVEGQSSVNINKAKRTVAVAMPEGSDLTALTVTKLTYTEGATMYGGFKEGDVVDLSEPKQFKLVTYDDYLWTVSAAIEEKPDNPDPAGEFTKDGPQLYNMGFDAWSIDPEAPTLNIHYCYAADASDEEKTVWGNANRTTIILGFQAVNPETEFLAVSGPGKSALKLESRNAIGKLAAGSLFTGKVVGISLANMTAELAWGVPFTARPAALEGYVCYKPQPVNIAQAPHENAKGELDKGSVVVMLTDWEEPFKVVPPTDLVDYDKDPAIIGFGRLTFDKEMTAYEKFTLKIDYRNERTPKYIVIVTSSSYLGDYFTGGEGSTIYFDEFALLYKK